MSVTFTDLLRGSDKGGKAKGGKADALDQADLPKDGLSDPIMRIPSGQPAFAAGSAFQAATSGAGSPIPYKGEMEKSFDRDFSSVNAHLGKTEQAASMGAVAATRNEDVVFSEASPSKETVAHELTHVSQFQDNKAPASSGAFGPSDSPAEHEADRTASSVARGESVSVGESPAGGIHLRKAPGRPLGELPDLVSAEGFAKATYVRFASRGGNLATIDRWLKTIDGYTTDADKDKFDYAVQQAMEACDHWLGEHADVTKQNKSVKARFPTVTALRTDLSAVATGDAATMAQSAALAPPPADAEEVETKGHLDVASAGADAVTGGVGQISAGIDIHSKPNDPDAKKGSFEELGGGRTDTIEGVGQLGGGLLKLAGGIGKIGKKDAKGMDKAEGGLNVVEGTTQTGQGVAKIVAGADKLAGGDGVGASKVSDGFGAGATAVSTITNGLEIYKGIKDRKKDPHPTAMQNVDFVAARTKNLVGISKGISDTMNNVVKATTGAAHAGASTASGAAGVITGSIDVLHGGYKIGTALKNKKEVEVARKGLDKTELELQAQILKVPEEKHGALALAVMENKTEAETEAIEASFVARLAELNAALQDIQARKADLNAAADAMDKVQDRRMRDGGLKMLTGGLDVATGALVLSGVGAPIALTLAVFSGLIKLGAMGLDAGRAWKTSKLTDIALRIGDDGRAKGKPDKPEEVGFRTMEKRVTTAYYKNFWDVLKVQAPPGFDDDQFGHVRDFVQEEKLGRVKEADTKTIPKDQVSGKAEGDLKGTWAKVPDGNASFEERPGWWRRRAIDLTFSAAKSAQAVDASNGELADALVDIGLGAFDARTGTFVPTPVRANAPDPTGAVDTAKAKMATALLGSVGIDDKVWSTLWRSAGGKIKGDPDTSTVPPGTVAEPKAPTKNLLTPLVKKKVDAT